jgi:hypothetical protein
MLRRIVQIMGLHLRVFSLLGLHIYISKYFVLKYPKYKYYFSSERKLQ